jgi:hypothetical protein
MRNLLWLLLLGGFFLTHLSADSVQYQLTSLGGGNYQYQYFLSGNFNPPDPGTYLALDITFDTSYSNLVNTSTASSSNWLTFVLQPVPGNPPGPGDYIAEAKITNPPLNGTFSVSFAYSPVSGDPAVPGSQAWMEDEFNKSDGSIHQPSVTLPSGLTTPQSIADPVVPEPSSFALSGMLLAVLICLAVRRKAHPATAPRA